MATSVIDFLIKVIGDEVDKEKGTVTAEKEDENILELRINTFLLRLLNKFMPHDVCHTANIYYHPLEKEIVFSPTEHWLGSAVLESFAEFLAEKLVTAKKTGRYRGVTMYLRTAPWRYKKI